MKNFRLVKPFPFPTEREPLSFGHGFTGVFSRKRRTWLFNVGFFGFPSHLYRFSVHLANGFLCCEDSLLALQLGFYRCASFCILVIGCI